MFDAVVTYYISGYQEVDSIGIFYDIPAGLELKSAEWALEGGTMANINQTNRQAAWTVDKAVSLSKETAARAPTCKEKGSNRYYTCETCGAMWFVRKRK